MPLAWNPFALPGAVAMVVGLALAGFIYFLGAGRSQNRRLAILLFCEAVVMSGGSLIYFFTDMPNAFGAQSLFITAMLAGPFVYLYFISTLSTPLVRWMKPRFVQVGILLVGLACQIYWLANPFLFIPGMVPVWYAPWEAILGAPFLFFLSFSGVVALYAVACAVSAYRRAPAGTATRSRAKLYAIAFGTRDLLYFVITFALPFFVPPPPSNTWWDAVYIWGFAFASLALCFLLVYGMLKTQLFDIDLRLKWTLSRGALAGVFLAVFLIVTQIIQVFAPVQLGILGGAVASGLLLFALNPLQQAATRMADAAMPRVTGSSEYLAFRKFQVYRAALEGAREDGEITHRERSMLARLRAELDIREEDAAMIERDLYSRPEAAA